MWLGSFSVLKITEIVQNLSITTEGVKQALNPKPTEYLGHELFDALINFRVWIKWKPFSFKDRPSKSPFLSRLKIPIVYDIETIFEAVCGTR